MSNPVNKYIYEESEEFEYQDIMLFSAGITWGFEKLPLAIGLAYAYEKDRAALDSLKLFAGFDMPLFTVY